MNHEQEPRRKALQGALAAPCAGARLAHGDCGGENVSPVQVSKTKENNE